MASSSSTITEIPNVLPSQVLSVSPSLPTSKLLDNLTKNQRILQSLPQNYEKRHFFTGVYKTLLDEFFFSHERADVQLYAAICLADIIRIWAPNLPDAPQEKQIKMFKFLARQLAGLKKIDDPLFGRRYYLLENLSLVQTFIPAVSLEEKNECQISIVVLTNIFNGVHKKHTDQLKALMIDVVSVILGEYEPLPLILVELLFARIIDPEKKLREECYDLVKSIIRQGESFLKAPIAEYFKMVLIDEDTEEFHLHTRIYNIFDELCRISDTIVDELIPTIEHRLTSNNEKHRRDTAKLVAFVSSAPKNDFPQRHKSLWKTFLEQFKNGTVEIQSTCMKQLKTFFVNHPELHDDLEDVMTHLSLSTDANIRTQLMTQIRAITNSNLLEISDKIKQILCERARDKIWEVRKEALEFLAQVYKKECVSSQWSNSTQKQLIWIANCIIHLYYQKSIQDKLLAERLLTFYLLPWDSEIQEKVRVFLLLYTNVSENAQRAIRDMIHSKFLFRRQLMKFVEFCLQMANKDICNDEKQLIEVKLVSLIHGIALRSLPNPEKNESILKAFAIFIIKQHKNQIQPNILTLFQRAISDEIKSKDSFALANQIGQILLDEATKEQKRFPTAANDQSTSEQNAHGQFMKMCPVIKTLFEKISTFLFDQWTVTELLRTISDRVSTEPELPATFYVNVNQLLKVFIQHPFIFNAPESLDFLCHLLKERILELAPILLRIVEGCSSLLIENERKELFNIFESEVRSYLSLHPPIAKRALHCLCALHPHEKNQLFTEIIETTDFEQYDSDQFITRLTLLGHMINICPDALIDVGKRILTTISNYIIEKETIDDLDEEQTIKSTFLHGHFTMLPDEPHVDPEIGADTRTKRELIKAMTRAIIGLKENSSSLFTLTYNLIRKAIQQDPDFIEHMSESEAIYIRLCGLSCLLKLISNNYFYSRIKPDDFLLIMTLLRDPSSIIRQRTYRKLAENLRDPSCPIELLALLAFAAKEPEREHREQIRRSMLQIIDTRREHIKLQLSYKTANPSQIVENETMDEHDDHRVTNTDETPIDYTLYPEYSLTYFLFFLSKSPAFILYDDVEMLHTMTEYILFLLDALLQRCDATVGLFYKGLLRSMKSSEDATISGDKEEKAERKDALKKLHVLVDLSYVILSQRASSLMICRASSDVPLPELYLKKTRYNSISYLPKDFKIKLKPISSTTVTELSAAAKRVSLNQSEATASSISVVKNSNRRKRKTDDDNDGPSTNKKRKSRPSNNVKAQRKTSIDSDESDQETKSDSLDDNGNRSITTANTDSVQTKRQIRYESSSSSSSSMP